MRLRRVWFVAGLAGVAIGLLGCATGGRRGGVAQSGDSMVFVGEEPAALAHVPIAGRPIKVRSTYDEQPGTIQYVEGRDFAVDYAQGTIRRLPDSALPDFRTNTLFGREGFDHSHFPGFGNAGCFAYADYEFRPAAKWPVQANQADRLKATQMKLRAGSSLKLVAFGDSITAGGDASRPELVFWRRWADALQRKYPAARITAINGATGGDSTVQGLQRLGAKVLAEQPDLVLVAFGMNDHNVGGVTVADFEQHLAEIIERIRAANRAEVILVSAFPPNPKWKFGSHHMEDYAAATERAARKASCAYADVYDNWQTIAARKKPEDLLANNINHPNDFGHWIYFEVLEAMAL